MAQHDVADFMRAGVTLTHWIVSVVNNYQALLAVAQRRRGPFVPRRYREVVDVFWRERRNLRRRPHDDPEVLG